MPPVHPQNWVAWPGRADSDARSGGAAAGRYPTHRAFRASHPVGTVLVLPGARNHAMTKHARILVPVGLCWARWAMTVLGRPAGCDALLPLASLEKSRGMADNCNAFEMSTRLRHASMNAVSWGVDDVISLQVSGAGKVRRRFPSASSAPSIKMPLRNFHSTDTFHSSAFRALSHPHPVLIPRAVLQHGWRCWQDR